jgi:hypothetical protein
MHKSVGMTEKDWYEYLRYEDQLDAARRSRVARLYAVQEKLEALGINPTDLIEFLADWQSHHSY